MSDMKDKELLAVCDLMALKIEHANIGNVIEDDGTILEYHTIESLIDYEIDGIKKRDKLKPSKEKVQEKRVQLEEDEVHRAHEGMPSKENENREYLEKMDKELEAEIIKEHGINKEKPLGSFYQGYGESYKDYSYSYHSKKELQQTAPAFMDFYDSLKNNGSVGFFLREWNPKYVADNYIMARETFRNRIDEYIKINQGFINHFEKAKNIESNSIMVPAFNALIILYRDANMSLESEK